MRFGMGMGLGLGAQSQIRNNDMILVYAIPSESTNIQLAIQANSTWFSTGEEVVIDWGDGSANQTVSNTGGSTYIEHTYASAGTYEIKISGSMTMYGRDSSVDIAGQTLLTRIDSFGKLGLTSLSRAFYKCTGLMAVPKTVPDSVTNMSNMFSYCSGAEFNPDVSNWDVSKVENMYYMFRDCRGDAFNPGVSNWNVSKATNMSGMFGNCRGAAFNPDVHRWDVSKVTNMSNMFSGCRGDAFNPNVTNWNVSEVTAMSYMFNNCYGAAFIPDMKSWTLKTGVTTAAMFTGSKIQPATWLNELLVAWAANPKQGDNITIDFSPNSFSETTEGEPIQAVATALQTLEEKGWTIATANPYSTPTP
jgi:hypothetical protein